MIVYVGKLKLLIVVVFMKRQFLWNTSLIEISTEFLNKLDFTPTTSDNNLHSRLLPSLM